jgi:hypothetical protein
MPKGARRRPERLAEKLCQIRHRSLRNATASAQNYARCIYNAEIRVKMRHSSVTQDLGTGAAD